MRGETRTSSRAAAARSGKTSRPPVRVPASCPAARDLGTAAWGRLRLTDGRMKGTV